MRTWIAALCCCASMMLVSDARAGTYDVWTCGLSAGTPTENAGWKPEGALLSSAWDSCSTGGLLTLMFGFDDIPSSWEAAWVLRAPADTEFDNLTFRRAVSISGDREYHLDLIHPRGVVGAPEARSPIEWCTMYGIPCGPAGSQLEIPFAPANTVRASGLRGAVGLRISLICQGRGTLWCSKANYPSNGMVRVWSPRVGLKDTLQPQFTAPPTGSLFSGQPVSDIQYVTFKATDKGGGIKSIGLLVDGVPHGDRLVDPASATCKAPYTKVVPCSLAIQPTMVVDTRELPNGPHSVRVTVTDVAGNVTQSDPYTVIARNGGQPNGANASRTAKLEAWFKSSRAHKTSATVRYGQRRTIEGRLTAPDGQPVAAAVLDLTAQAARPASATRAIGTVVTDRDGRFKVQAPRGSSRTVRIGYPLHARRRARGDGNPEPERQGGAQPLRHAQAGPQRQRRHLPRAAPRRSWAVRDAGDDLCARRAPRDPGGDCARRPSRPLSLYRFRTIAGSTRFSFRAVVKAQPNYPYARGASSTVSVRARP